jgi:hypothetical protein
MQYLAPVRAAVLAACAIGLSDVSVRLAADASTLGGRGRCERSLLTQERAWKGTGDWRKLAPYPVARDASPTDSIGVWLERWQLQNGDVELRRVSAEKTTVAATTGAACDLRLVEHRRHFDEQATAGAFTDASLRAVLEHTTAGMIYVWSPRMPLSVRGIAEAHAAARSLGIAFTAIVADAAESELRSENVDTAFEHSLNSLELMYRNAALHYPTVTFYRGGSLLGSAVPGYKTRDAYVALARDAFTEMQTGRSAWSTAPAPASPPFWVDHKARVTTMRTIPTPRAVGFFFKPVAGTDFIAYTTPEPNPSESVSYLFDLGTRREVLIPGRVDPVPTPDGRLITRPGLLFHSVKALLAGDTTILFSDTDVPDQYQTASILKRSASTTRYRVVTGWGMSTRMRTYDVSFDRSGKPTRVEPLARPAVPCPERAFSLPMSAKAGTEFGAYDRVSKTYRILDVDRNGECIDVLDLGFASGKLAFSYDGKAVAFATSRIDVDAEGGLLKPEEMFYRDAIVLYRATGRMVALSANRPLSGMTFPEFLPDGRIILLDQKSRLRPTEVIRIVEVQ